MAASKSALMRQVAGLRKKVTAGSSFSGRSAARIAAIGAGAMTAGVVASKYGSTPALVSGVALVVLGMGGLGGKHAGLVLAAGEGSIAGWFYNKGVNDVAPRLKLPAALTPGAAPAAPSLVPPVAGHTGRAVR